MRQPIVEDILSGAANVVANLTHVLIVTYKSHHGNSVVSKVSSRMSHSACGRVGFARGTLLLAIEQTWNLFGLNLPGREPHQIEPSRCRTSCFLHSSFRANRDRLVLHDVIEKAS
jgi:hypothetical protein